MTLQLDVKLYDQQIFKKYHTSYNSQFDFAYMQIPRCICLRNN